MKNFSVKQVTPFVVLVLVAVASIFVPSLPNFDEGKYNGADTAWIIVATALVFLMTPGLAFFYGGMVHRKNVISTMIKSVVAAGVVSVLWVTVGYSLCFGQDIGGFIGNPMTHLFFKGVNNGEPWVGAPTIPKTLFSLFQLMFAVITPGLVVGAVAERFVLPLIFCSQFFFLYWYMLLLHTGAGIRMASCLKWERLTLPAELLYIFQQVVQLLQGHLF
jgi:Amt family ammonium transporter